MSREEDANREMFLDAVGSLGSLRERAVFVGGSVVGLLTFGSAHRATKDVDLVVSAKTAVEYEHLVAMDMRALGWSEDASDGAPRCWWVHPVGGTADVMTATDAGFGFSNRWYPGVMRTATTVEVEPGVSVLVVSLPYWIATKLEAFAGRGKGDWVTSTDIEDVLAVVSTRADLVEAVESADSEVRGFLIERCRESIAIEHRPLFRAAHAHFESTRDGRAAAEVAVRRLIAVAALSPPTLPRNDHGRVHGRIFWDTKEPAAAGRGERYTADRHVRV